MKSTPRASSFPGAVPCSSGGGNSSQNLAIRTDITNTTPTCGGYTASRLESVEQFLNEAARLGSTATSMPFTMPAWIGPLYSILADNRKAEPVLVAVYDARSGQMAMLLPMLRRVRLGCTIVEFADLGVCDYSLPVIGPAAPVTRAEALEAWTAVAGCLPRADLVRMEKLPASAGGRINPLTLLDVAPSQAVQNAMELPATWDGYLASCSKKFRKDLRYKSRILTDELGAAFRVVTDVEEALSIISRLDAFQRERLDEQGENFKLDHPPYSDFYRQAVRCGVADGSIRIAILEAKGAIVAATVILLIGDTCTLVRLGYAGGEWSRYSPAIVLVGAVIRWLIERGVRTFDFGVGQYAYKQRFGCEPTKLCRLELATNGRGRVCLSVWEAALAVLRVPFFRRILIALLRRATMLRAHSHMKTKRNEDASMHGAQPMTEYTRGNVVEIKSEAEILATLDARGALEGMPFMPEMRQFCGRRFRVARRADRTCVEGLGERDLNNTVFIEDLRCSGAAHDGCQRGCLLFWKSDWLRPVSDEETAASVGQASTDKASSDETFPYPVKHGDTYYCQSTELTRATQHKRKSIIGSVGELANDVHRGELSVARFIWMLGSTFIRLMEGRLGVKGFTQLRGPGAERSKGNLDLEVGDWVMVRPLAEISATLDKNGKNNGLAFDREMVFYSGPYEVEQKIEKIILETNGKMRHIARTVTLKGVNCQGLCAKNCPRANPIYWREIWLKRVPAPGLSVFPE